MIKDSWKNTKLICGFCNEEMQFEIAKTMKYKCPKCSNDISVNHYEKILDKISDIEDEKYMKKEIGDLIGEKMTVGKAIKCEITDDDCNGHITVMVKNIERGR